MGRRDGVVSALALALIVGAAVAPASAGATVYYLHSLAPSGNVEGAAPQAGSSVEPWMDAVPPTGTVAKVSASSAGNRDYRKNPLLAWWSGQVHGTVTNLSVRLFVVAEREGTFRVTIFGDGGVGVSGAVGTATATLAPGAQEVVLAVPVTAAIAEEMVLSVDMGQTGAQVLYDSVDAPSSVSFDLGPYVPPPPVTVPPPSDGWEAGSVVHATKANRESSLAIDPTDENRMMMCDPSGVPAIGEGHSYFYDTIDGGITWRELDPEAPGDTRSYAFEGGDCDVAYDAGGTLYTADTWLGSLSVGASLDDGATWHGTALAGSSPFVDRPWLTGGPDGTIHVTYQDVQFGMPSAIWYTRSIDHGRTFSPAVSITTANQDGAYTWTGNFVVTPDGQSLYSVYTRRRGPVISNLDASGPETVWVAASHDGGLTWTSHLVASMPNPASYLYPSIALDDGGMLHAVFSSRTDTDRPIWYTVSSDQAQTWSSPVKLRAGEAAYAPWIDAGAHGEAVVQWYGSPNAAADFAGEYDWYVSWARISDAETGSAVITSGTTTSSPLFRGVATMPEFNMVRLGDDGKMRIGASSLRRTAGGTAWAAYFFAES